MAWVGNLQDVMQYLSAVEADRGEAGAFVISGEPVVTELEASEVVIPDGTIYFRGGAPRPLAAGLEARFRQRPGAVVHDDQALNPARTVHREAFQSYMKSAENHVKIARSALQNKARRRAWDAIRHADCDIRQAYTEAMYGRRDDAELGRMTGRIEQIYPEVTRIMVELREQA